MQSYLDTDTGIFEQDSCLCRATFCGTVSFGAGVVFKRSGFREIVVHLFFFGLPKTSREVSRLAPPREESVYVRCAGVYSLLPSVHRRGSQHNRTGKINDTTLDSP